MCFDDDIEDLEATCPKCGQNPIRRRDCTNFCEDGYFDVVWCPKCGADLTLDKIKWDEEY